MTSQVHPDSALPSDPDYGAQFDTVEAQYAALARGIAADAGSEQDERVLFDKAFLSWNGFHTQAELDAEWNARGGLAATMFREGFSAASRGAAEASDPVVEANRQLMLDRSRVGVEKYRTTLAASGLTDKQLLQHALEEVLDLANYIQAILSKPE